MTSLGSNFFLAPASIDVNLRSSTRLPRHGHGPARAGARMHAGLPMGGRVNVGRCPRTNDLLSEVRKI